MPFPVFLTKDAARDLEELYDYIAIHDTRGKTAPLPPPKNALKVLNYSCPAIA
jgi:hypothetical protein